MAPGPPAAGSGYQSPPADCATCRGGSTSVPTSPGAQGARWRERQGGRPCSHRTDGRMTTHAWPDDVVRARVTVARRPALGWRGRVTGCVFGFSVKSDARGERPGPQRSNTRTLQVPDRRLPRLFPVGSKRAPRKGRLTPGLAGALLRRCANTSRDRPRSSLRFRTRGRAAPRRGTGGRAKPFREATSLGRIPLECEGRRGASTPPGGDGRRWGRQHATQRPRHCGHRFPSPPRPGGGRHTAGWCVTACPTPSRSHPVKGPASFPRA